MIALLFCPKCNEVYGCFDTDADLELHCETCPYTEFIVEFGGTCAYLSQAEFEVKKTCPLCFLQRCKT